MQGAAAIFLGFANAEFGLAADFEGAFAAKGLEEAVEEELGFAFFIAGDVGGGPSDEFLEAGFAVGGHAVEYLLSGAERKVSALRGRGAAKRCWWPYA